MRIQLAFQGGGARIVVLLAAAEAIEELIGEGEDIVLTNIAGTSAGAIIGAFLAADVPLGDVRAELAGERGAQLLSAFPPPSWLRAAWDIGRGAPFWDDRPLREWLAGHFKHLRTQAPPRIGDIKERQLFVVSSNLSNGEPKKSSPEDDLVGALLDSSGLPFCFRSWKSGNGALIVDGGLCENLPVDDLLPRTGADGPILAFSFRRSSPGNPKGALGFAGALLDVAINRSVQVAADRLGADSVCTLDTNLKTFDFAEARAFLGSKEYRETKEHVKAWVQQRLSDENRPLIDYWGRDISPQLLECMTSIGRAYATQHERQKLNFRSVRFLVQCNCLAEQGQRGYQEPDEVFYELVIAARNEPIFAHRLTLSTPRGLELFGRHTVKVFDESDQPVPFELVPSITPDSPTDRALIVFFNSPLVPNGGEYRISIHDIGKELMVGLRKHGGEDGLCAAFSRVEGPVGKLQFGLHVPERFREIAVKRSTLLRRQFVQGGVAAREFGPPPFGFRTLGVCATDVPDAKYVEMFFQS